MITMKQHRGMECYQANPGPMCRCSYDVAAILSQGNSPSCIALSSCLWSTTFKTHMMLHECMAVLQDKGHEEKEKEGPMESSNHWTTLNQLSQFSVFFSYDLVFLFHPTAVAQPSHPQLSTSAQPQVKLGEPKGPSSILESSMLSTMDSVPSVPSVLDHPDFDGSSAKASVYDYEKLQAVQKVSPVLSFMSKPKHLYLKGIPWLSYGFP